MPEILIGTLGLGLEIGFRPQGQGMPEVVIGLLRLVGKPEQAKLIFNNPPGFRRRRAIRRRRGMG